MADYLILWVDHALEQYLALTPDLRSRLDERLRQLAANPTRNARYDPSTDRWTTAFDNGRGLMLYIASEQHRRIVILRILHIG